MVRLGGENIVLWIVFDANGDVVARGLGMKQFVTGLTSAILEQP